MGFCNTILFHFTACNVGDEGGFAPNIQDNKEGKCDSSSCPLDVCHKNISSANAKVNLKNVSSVSFKYVCF